MSRVAGDTASTVYIWYPSVHSSAAGQMLDDGRATKSRHRLQESVSNLDISYE